MACASKLFFNAWTSLRLSHAAEDNRRPVVEFTRPCESTMDHRRYRDAAVLQCGAVCSVYTRRLQDRSALQQRRRRGNEILRAAADQRQLGAARRYRVDAQSKDSLARRLRPVLGSTSSAQPVRTERS